MCAAPRVSDDAEQSVRSATRAAATSPRTATCSTPTPTWPQEFDLRMRMVVRQVATVVVFEIGGRRLRSRAVVRAAARRPGLLLLDGMIAVDVAGRRPHRDRAHRARRPAAAVGPGAPTSCSSARASWRALLPGARSPSSTPPSPSASARGRRSCTRCCAGPASAPATSTSSARSPPSRGSRCGWRSCSGTSPARWGKVEPGGIRLSLPLTHRLLGQLIGAERPSVSHALARLAAAGLVTGRADEWHLHGTVEEPPRRLVERDAHAAPDARAGGHAPSTAARRG